MKDFKIRKDKLVSDVLRRYHYNEWVRITHNRNLYDIPEHMQKLFYAFGYWTVTPALNDEMQKMQLKKLRKIRMHLKWEFRKIKMAAVFMKYFNIERRWHNEMFKSIRKI